MPTLILTGANRGLGLEFARQYAAAGWRVIATCRDPAKAGELRAVAASVEIEPLDVGDLDAVRRFAGRLGDMPVDLLIANAGVNEPQGRSLADIDAQSWEEVFRVNSMAPVVLAHALRSNFRRGNLAGEGQCKAVAISSGLGSIGNNDQGGLYLYRASKAALNAAWRSFARDNPDLIAVVASPGWVRTDMGGPGAPLTPAESVAGLRRLIAGLTRGDSGKFFDHDGAELPW